MSLFDRFAAGLETLGKRANQALDEGKLRVELVRVRRRMDNAARDLGYLTYRQIRGTAGAPADIEALTRRIAEAETAAARLEADIAQLKQRSGGGAASGGGNAETPAGHSGPAESDTASPPSSVEAAPGS